MSSRAHEYFMLAGVYLLILIALLAVFLRGVGKYQLCRAYFQEMSTAACFFTDLPAVNTGARR